MGQSINRVDELLAPFARRSRDKYYKTHIDRLGSDMEGVDVEEIEKLARKYADEDMRKEIKDGVQTIQYQINTLD